MRRIDTEVDQRERRSRSRASVASITSHNASHYEFKSSKPDYGRVQRPMYDVPRHYAVTIWDRLEDLSVGR